MNANQTELSYRRASVQEASAAGLVVILYDILASDLQQAIAAMRSGKIEARCARLKHGLLVLQLLQGSLDLEKGGPAAHDLSRFYAHIRSQILEAQFKCVESILEDQVALVLDVREAWRQVDSGAGSHSVPHFAAPPNPPTSDTEWCVPKDVNSWSA